MAESAARSHGQRKVGVVVGKPGRKTIKVKVERLVKHPLYKRVIKRSKGFLAHDEREICDIGDKVEIVECRPLSARKRWRLGRIVARPEGAAQRPE
ncbi:MAG: 30S ribosomal protein S17 [Acidobacteriota bacterium]|nr:MAG: 30S ribosomal protein S17 [Acidobacteriota bacterium]